MVGRERPPTPTVGGVQVDETLTVLGAQQEEGEALQRGCRSQGRQRSLQPAR